MLERGADVNAAGPGTEQVPAGGTALMLAAARNHKDVVQLLLSNDADPNQADQGGGTAREGHQPSAAYPDASWPPEPPNLATLTAQSTNSWLSSSVG